MDRGTKDSERCWDHSTMITELHVKEMKKKIKTSQRRACEVLPERDPLDGAKARLLSECKSFSYTGKTRDIPMVGSKEPCR